MNNFMINLMKTIYKVHELIYSMNEGIQINFIFLYSFLVFVVWSIEHWFGQTGIDVFEFLDITCHKKDFFFFGVTSVKLVKSLERISILLHQMVSKHIIKKLGLLFKVVLDESTEPANDLLLCFFQVVLIFESCQIKELLLENGGQDSF